ncbi:MAG: hypothetical protein U0547_00255 [Dehalococcoidia bacterium]
MDLWVDIEGREREAAPGGGAALIAFMSFAVSRGFGATHPLIALADRLHETHRVRLGPLTTFYEADAEDSEDVEKLELAWQPAAELAEALTQLTAALEADPLAATLARRGLAEPLAAEARALASVLAAPAAEGARVRLAYSL